MSSPLPLQAWKARVRRERSVLLVAAIATALPAEAHEGYAQNVKEACAKAGRPVPTFADNDCTICHQNANNQQAYQSGDFLEVFCKTSPDNGGGGTTDSPPVLEHQASPQTAVVGRTFQLTLAATDAEDDILALTAKKLPAGAKLGKTARSNGKWTAVLTWKPKKKQTGKTYTTQFVATETRHKPKLSVTQTVAFFVGAASGLSIVQSRYESGVLSVSGTLEQAGGSGLSSALEVEIQRGNGEALGTAAVAGQRDWTLTLPLPHDSVPCEIRAVVGNEILAAESVKTAQAGCR